MIKHIVTWKMLPDNFEENRLECRRRLEALPDIIPEIVDFEVGLNLNDSERALDLVLVSSFRTREDLGVYSAHPAHQEVVGFLRSVTEYARVVDYEV